jgi:hypothetical protein
MRTSGRSIIERVEKAGWVMSEREEGVARQSDNSDCLVCVEPMLAGNALIRLPCLFTQNQYERSSDEP